MPHLVEFDHHRRADRIGFLRVGCHDLLQLNIDGRQRDVEKLGRAAYRQPADREQYGGLHGQRLALDGHVGEVQAALLALVALLAAHQPVPGLLFAPTALAAKHYD